MLDGSVYIQMKLALAHTVLSSSMLKEQVNYGLPNKGPTHHIPSIVLNVSGVQ